MQNVIHATSNYIANASVPSSSGRTLAVIDPSDGQPFDEIQRSNADDIDAAVRAARQCYQAVWQHGPGGPGRLLQKLSAKVLEHADEADGAGAARLRQTLNRPGRCRGAGALLRVLCRGLRQTARRNHFPTWTATACSPGASPRRHRPHHPVELPHADLWPQRGRRAGGRQCVRGQTGRRCLPVADPRGATGGRVGFPPGPSTSSRATGTKWAMRWHATRALTTSASPAAPRWARSFSRWPPSATAP